MNKVQLMGRLTRNPESKYVGGSGDTLMVKYTLAVDRRYRGSNSTASLGYTVDIERLRDAYREAKQNPADEITFKWLRMNMWVSSTTSWIPDSIFMKGNEPIDMRLL